MPGGGRWRASTGDTAGGNVSVQERRNRVPENQKGNSERGGADGALAPVMRDLRFPRGDRRRASTRVVRHFSDEASLLAGFGPDVMSRQCQGGADGALAPAIRRGGRFGSGTPKAGSRKPKAGLENQVLDAFNYILKSLSLNM